MEGCTPVSANSADTTLPQTTTTPLELATATAEATSTAIASTSSDMSLTAALESSCTLSDSFSPADATLATGAADLPRPSHSSPFVVASAADAPSCGGGCTGTSSSSAAEAEVGVAPTMTSIDESTTTPSHNHTHNTNNKIDKSKKKRKVVRIDIYSDTTCPWCYITKKRLEKAIHAFQLASSSPSDSTSINADSSVVVHEGCSSNSNPPPPAVKPSAQSSSSDPSPSSSSSFAAPPINPTLPPREEEIHFDIHWRPFQLDPQAPREPIRKTKMYHRKFGTEKTLQVQERVAAAGKAEGVIFTYSDQSLYSNTIDSHRVLRFARERLGRLPLGTTREEEAVVVEEEGRRKMVDSGNALNGSYHLQAQDQEDYFPTYTPANHQEEDSYFSCSPQEEEEEEEEEVDEWGARMEDAMVDELFRSHFERGECSEFETLISCARSVLVQTAAFSAAAAAALSLSLPPSSSSASSLHEPNNTNESTEEKEHTARLLKAKEQELIDQQLEELDLYLHSDEGLDEVREEIRVAKEDLGMQGVPMIVIQNEYLLSGAQTTNTFVQVLQRVI
ncbi:hypothetical protein F5H01DRAFT_342316 [Linnemannia elongata]|nr:hypothetical protein F5H01DRAFT_342316 [Linnemannia elongata]